jgi:hypothetical protein
VQQPCSYLGEYPELSRKGALGPIQSFAGNLQYREMPRKLSFGTEDKRRSMTKMTREERKLFDAQADHEAWSLAHEILEP